MMEKEKQLKLLNKRHKGGVFAHPTQLAALRSSPSARHLCFNSITLGNQQVLHGLPEATKQSQGWGEQDRLSLEKELQNVDN
jgi:hypothetical protein